MNQCHLCGTIADWECESCGEYVCENCTMSYNQFTIKFQRKPTHFSRWMNLVNNFINIFGSLK